METKRRLLILTALALLLPTFASPSITSAAEHTFSPPGEVIDAQILEATQDQKTNALMTAIHAQKDEIGALYRQWPLEELA